MMQVASKQKVLSENDLVATAIRSELEANRTLALNFIGSPGSGKTTFLERTLQMLAPGTGTAVLTGDILMTLARTRREASKSIQESFERPN